MTVFREWRLKGWLVGRLAPGAGLALAATRVSAQSTKADGVASCNASFHLTCIDGGITVDFSGSAAPFHGVGDHPLEFLLAVAALLVFVLVARAGQPGRWRP